MLNSGLLISISGIDGSGKTTLAHKIIEFLDNHYGLSSHYVWCKFGEHPLSRFRISQYINKNNKNSDGSCRSDKPASITYRFYGALMLLIHLAQVYLVVRNSLKRGEILICDRYIYDSIVDLQQEFHFSPKFIHEIFNSKWIPQPNFRYLLDLPEQQAFVRKTDTESVEFLNVRREIYKSFANEYELVVIDANNPVDVILKTITDTIEISAIFEKGFS